MSRVLQNKYEILELIGKGGMGEVYAGRHLATTRRVAVKFLLPKLASNAKLVRRFEREARAAGGLEHPNIAAVLDCGRTPEGASYLVMEYLEGETCESLLARERSIAVPRAVNIVRQVCEGLAVAHAAGLVHRDIKPANLFLCRHRQSDGSELVKLLDFGIAKWSAGAGASRDTSEGAALGTARYMSPEQARGEREVDPRSDVYALGATLYELLGHQHAHDGDSTLEIVFNILHTPPKRLSELRPELPERLVSAVERAMDLEPERRFQSALEFKHALDAFAWRPEGGAQFDGVPVGASDATRPADTAVEATLLDRAITDSTEILGPVWRSARSSRERSARRLRAAATTLLATAGGMLLGALLITRARLVDRAVSAAPSKPSAARAAPLKPSAPPPSVPKPSSAVRELATAVPAAPLRQNPVASPNVRARGSSESPLRPASAARPAPSAQPGRVPPGTLPSERLEDFLEQRR